MSVRGVRVALVFVLLAMTFATFSSAGAAELQGRRAPDLGDLAFEHEFRQAPNIKRFMPSARAEARESREMLTALDDKRQPQLVVGPDSRIQVADTTVYPYSAIAQLIGFDQNLPDGIVSTCTATFVGPDVLLTAAHCVWSDTDFGGWIDDVEITPGMNGELEPFGYTTPESIWIPDEYLSDHEPGSPWDYALITVSDTSVEATVGSLTVGILTTGELQAGDFNATTSGYPGDKPAFTQWISSEASFSEVNGDWLVHAIDSYQGQSGSALWRGSDLAIVGVESWEDNQNNYAVRLDLENIYDLMGACVELDCQLNHYLTDIPGDGGAYDRVWARTDQPVASGAEPRTWMWGPAPIGKVMLEPYAEAPNGFRTVLYQEKSRMEITDPNSDANSIWYVTNGLATVELMTGNLQLGNNAFEQHNPAQINVAGDGNDPNAPTYVTFAGLRELPPHGGALAGPAQGPVITATVDRAGNVGDDPSLATHGVTADQYVPDTGHRIATPFWEFMNSSGTVWQDGQFVEDLLFNNPYFATGFPITEAYWTTVLVGGTPRTVLVQAFERRVLTYTPGNPEGFVVEAGNVGAHYFHWRYELIPAESPGGEEPVDPPPAVGELVAIADFATWPEVETTFGDTGMPVEDVYQITNPSTGFLQLLGDGQFGDGYFSLEARATQTSAAGAACLLYRADPFDENPLFNDFAYWFCLFYQGQEIVAVVTVYETAAGITELGGAEFIEPYPLASEWHQIGVVAKGQKFWFVVDNQVLGSMTHDIGPGSGQIGILTLNLDEAEDGPDAIFQLRNLEIYALAP